MNPSEATLSVAETNAYIYSGNNPVSRVDPLGLWSIRVHRWDTYAWARSVGFSRRQSVVIGYSDHRVDKLWNSDKVVLVGIGAFPRPTWPNRWRHFDTDYIPGESSLIRAMKYYYGRAQKEFRRNQNKFFAFPAKYARPLKYLGWGMHSRQDYYSHPGNYVPGRHRSWWDDEADSRRKARWRSTKDKTKQILRAWLTWAQKAQVERNNFGRQHPIRSEAKVFWDSERGGYLLHDLIRRNVLSN